MVHPPWNDGGNREIPSSFFPLFGNSIDMMLLYSSHLRRDGASPFLKRHCCFFFLLINRKLKEKHLEILKGASIKCGALRNSFSSEGDMWQGVEYTAAPGGMEEAIKNYCKKETGEPLLFFPGKCTKIPAGLLSQEIAGIFSMKKDMTQISCHIFCFR